MSTVISVRIRRELKEEAERLGIDLKGVIEKALAEEISRVKSEKLKRLLEEGLRSFEVAPEEWADAVRKSRRER